TRIFDALKKAEASRPGGALPQASVTPIGQTHVASGARAMPPAQPRLGSDVRVALPLMGSLELTPDTVREMTALRVTLESALGERTPRVVMFVSPQGGEGTSTVSLQFAQVLSRDASVRPLLIDAHVRRPVYEIDPTHRAALLEPRLQKQNEPATSPTPNLFVVPNADDLRRSGIFQPAEMRQVLDATTAGFDWVVIDGPPVLESPDAAPLSGVADAVVLVVQAGRTKRPVLVRSAELLKKAGANVLGSVLNRRVLEIPEFIYRRI
ncbi:MAG: CpsD/CapB family tyrosine-protein kinase, partial [Candidatus Eisenbacteria bacterium]